MKTSCRVILLLVLGSLPAGRSEAVDLSRWTLRLQASAADYSRTQRNSYGLGVTYFELSDGRGFNVAGEYRVRPRFAWEASFGQLALDAYYRSARVYPISFNPLVLGEETTVSDSGNLTLQPLLIAALFHPLRQNRVDVYGGPVVGLVLFDVDVADLQERDPELSYGGKVGVVVRLGSRWSDSLEGRHLEVVHESLERDLYGDLGLTSASLGLAYHLRSASHRR